MSRLPPVALLALPGVFLVACTDDGDAFDEDDPGIALLGDGSHGLDGLSVDVAVDSRLDDPRDVAFHPDAEWQLWVANAGNDSVTLVDGLDGGSVDADKRSGANARHFLANPTALAFGPDGTLATAHDEDETTQQGTPTDFMGPTLWPSDVADFDGGHGSHLDMLHNSPNSVGIAAAGDSEYWVYDGYHGSLTLYRFHADHGMGGSDHSDGELLRYLDGELGYEEDVASHIALDAETGLLYAADTANNRIIVLDTSTGVEGKRISPNYDGGSQNKMDDADWWVLIDGADAGLELPSGLELHDGLLWVSDFGTSRIAAFDLDGEMVDWLDTGVAEASLMGMAFAPDGSLFIANASDGQVLRLSID